MQIEYDFAQDVDPVKFVLKERIGFLHRFKQYANLLKSPKLNDEGAVRLGRMMAREVNNYRLVLNSSQGRMPDEKAEDLLSILGAFMDQMWNERNTLGKDMVFTADEVILAYEELSDYLSSI